MVYGYQNLLQIRLDHDTSAKSVFTFQGRKQQRFFMFMMGVGVRMFVTSCETISSYLMIKLIQTYVYSYADNGFG